MKKKTKQLPQQNQEQRITRILYFLNNPSEFHYFYWTPQTNNNNNKVERGNKNNKRRNVKYKEVSKTAGESAGDFELERIGSD